MSTMLQHLIMFYKYGGKQLHYPHHDGQGEIDVDKFDVDDKEQELLDDITDENCDSVQKIKKRRFMKKMTVFDSKKRDQIESKAFLDGGVNIQRYDTVKYPLDNPTDKQLGFLGDPKKLIFKDAKDFKDLTDPEKHILTANLETSKF